MPTHELYHLAGTVMWLCFVFCFGACVGSLTNVLVYRLPLGLGVITPPSRCPACDTRLTWRENIPVLGWLLLRGRCRFCRSPISPEYPLVEALFGLAFCLFFALWYLTPADSIWLGIDWGAVKPEWARADAWERWPRASWPSFLVLLMLIASLLAMTIVDAKTFTIPLQIPWAATIVGLLGHTAHAVYLSFTDRSAFLRAAADGWLWSIPTPGGDNPASPTAWWWIGASLGGVLGLGAGLLLIHFRLISRSFADYDQWEAAQHAASPVPAAEPAPTDASIRALAAAELVGEHALTRRAQYTSSLIAALGLFVALIALAALLERFVPAARSLGPPWAIPLFALLAAPFVAAYAWRKAAPQLAPAPDAPTSPPTHMWIQYPHARREMIRELAFLAPCGLFAAAGGWLATTLTAGQTLAAPLWLSVLCGVLMGYLIGGGIVWAVRITGSLAFGKEAMGLGDVHLMAAVGACAGWIDAAIAFPLAALVGLYGVLVGRVGSGSIARAMPFGPNLALATLAVLLTKPLIELGLSYLAAIPPGETAINIP